MIIGKHFNARHARSLLRQSFILCNLLQLTTGYCPAVCHCKWRDGKETVTCHDADFIDIPKGLDPTTQILDLTRNRLTILPKGAFIDTGLVNLQKVWMNLCKLTFVEKGAFEKLANLVELDLSDNFLRSVPTEALSDIAGLRNLYLARNNIGPLPASIFASVPLLIRLDLSFNGISSINIYAFQLLSRLEVLKLSGNNMNTLSVNVLKPLVTLYGLHVDNNPWHCDCHLRLLRRWLQQRNVAASVPPHCDSPDRISGRGWQSLEEDEFVCVPVVTAVVQVTLAANGDNVSLSCHVETDTNAELTWLLNDREVMNSSSLSDYKYQILEFEVPKTGSLMSNLTIYRAAIQDQGIYRCVAENKAGRVEANFTLKVSHKIKETALVTLDKVFVTGILLCCIALIFVIVIFLCIILSYRNRKTNVHGKVVSCVNLSNSQVTLGKYNKSYNNNKEMEYHVVPKVENYDKCSGVIKSVIQTTENSRNMKVSSSSRETEKEIVSNNKNTFVLTGVSKAVSFVEIPRSDSRETDQLLKEIYRETSFVTPNEVMSSQAAFVGCNILFPDLLDIPRVQQVGSMDRLPFCTIPRRYKRECATLEEDQLSEYKFSGFTSQNSHHLSFRTGGEFIKLREAAVPANPKGERIKWSSEVCLELSGDVSGATTPLLSYQSTPLTSTTIGDKGQIVQMQKDSLTECIQDSQNAWHDSSAQLISIESVLSDPVPFSEQLIESFQNNYPNQIMVIEEIKKLRAQKEGSSKLTPYQSVHRRIETAGDLTPTTRARQYECHARQLDRFLQEYKSLQEQLYKMKESCDSMQQKRKVSNS